jgi:uncharacterized protein YciI
MENTFVYLVRPIREDFPENVTAEEGAIVERHFGYLESALQSRQLILAGPCEDAAFGICLFRAKNLSEAQKFMENDPAVKEKLFSGELHAYRLALYEHADE